MRQLVSYTCSACGGALYVDRKQEVFECPFCGNAFDFARLHREDILNEAAVNMRNMEYTAAREKFNSVLESDPQNFKALLGLALCDGNLLSEDSINRLDKMSGCSFEPMKKTLIEVKDRASEDDALYFAKLIEMIEIAQKHLELKQRREDITKDSRSEFKRSADIDIEHEQVRQELEGAAAAAGDFIVATFVSDKLHTGEETDSIIGAGSILGLGIILSGYLLINYGFIAALIPIGVVLLFLIMYYVSLAFDKRAQKHISEEMKEIHSKEAVVSRQIAEVEKQYAEAYAELKKLEAGMNKTSPGAIRN